MFSTSRPLGRRALARRGASTRRHAIPGPRHRQDLFAVVAIFLGLTAGCGHGSTVNPPTKTTPPGGGVASRSASPSMSSKDAVIAAYTGYYPALDEALRSPAGRIRSILNSYVTEDFLDFQVRQLVDEQARHLEPWGRAVAHITAVDIRQNTATIRDCQDASNAGLADAQTHQVVPELRGTAHRNLTATLTLGGDGRWRLSDLRQFKAGCHA